MDLAALGVHVARTVDAEPSLESLSGMARSGDPRALPALAKQFESVFMTQILKEMRQTLEPGTMFGSDPGDVQGGMFDSLMGRYLAGAGGIGLANVMMRQFTRPSDSGFVGGGVTAGSHERVREGAMPSIRKETASP